MTLFGWSTGLEEILRYAQDDSIDGSGRDCHTDKHHWCMRRRYAAPRNNNRFRWMMKAKPPEVKFWRLVVMRMGELNLRQVILDDQQGTGGGGGVVAAEELHVVGTHIIVIILLEAQAELGGTCFIDIGTGCAAQRN